MSDEKDLTTEQKKLTDGFRYSIPNNLLKKEGDMRKKLNNLKKRRKT